MLVQGREAYNLLHLLTCFKVPIVRKLRSGVTPDDQEYGLIFRSTFVALQMSVSGGYTRSKFADPRHLAREPSLAEQLGLLAGMAVLVLLILLGGPSREVDAQGS